LTSRSDRSSQIHNHSQQPLSPQSRSSTHANPPRLEAAVQPLHQPVRQRRTSLLQLQSAENQDCRSPPRGRRPPPRRTRWTLLHQGTSNPSEFSRISSYTNSSVLHKPAAARTVSKGSCINHPKNNLRKSTFPRCL
jgi:hypothetical protein